MSMAMKYAMKKRARKMGEECVGPECGGCSSASCMAEGGFVKEEEASGYQDMPEPEDDGSEGLVDRIMKRFSKGGEVANDTPPVADFEDNDFDDLAKDDDLEFSDTGANSGDEIGDGQEDEDRHDIVKRIMKSRGKKDHLPRPA